MSNYFSKGHGKTTFGPYEHVEHVAEFSGFANVEVTKRKSNLLTSFLKIINQMGSFGQI